MCNHARLLPFTPCSCDLQTCSKLQPLSCSSVLCSRVSECCCCSLQRLGGGGRSEGHDRKRWGLSFESAFRTSFLQRRMVRLCDHPLYVFLSGEAALTKLLLQSAMELLLQVRQAEMRGIQRICDTCLLRTFSLVLSVRHHALLLAAARVVVSQGCMVMGEGSCAWSVCALSACVQKVPQATYQQQTRTAHYIRWHTCVECIGGESSKNMTSVRCARVVLPKATVSRLASLQSSLKSRTQSACPLW